MRLKLTKPVFLSLLFAGIFAFLVSAIWWLPSLLGYIAIQIGANETWEYQGFQLIGNNKFRVLLVESKGDLPIYLRNPDNHEVIALTNLTESAFRNKFGNLGFVPVDVTDYSDKKLLFVSYELKRTEIRFEQGRFRSADFKSDVVEIGNNSKGPFYQLSFSRKEATDLFGRPIHRRIDFPRGP